MRAMLLNGTRRLNNYDIFLIWHCVDIRPSEIRKKPFWGNKTVHFRICDYLFLIIVGTVVVLANPKIKCT
jgi:hypothetical protein